MKYTVIRKIKKLGDKLFEVELETNKNNLNTIQVNTILMAIGRDPNPLSFGSDNANIKIHEGTRKILGRVEEPERTNIDHIYAVGDVVHNVPELMPVA